MNLRKALSVDDIVPDVAAEATLERIRGREGGISAGVGHGMVIPHGKTVSVGELTACIGRSSTRIDFRSPDGERPGSWS